MVNTCFGQACERQSFLLPFRSPFGIGIRLIHDKSIPVKESLECECDKEREDEVEFPTEYRDDIESESIWTSKRPDPGTQEKLLNKKAENKKGCIRLKRVQPF